MAVDALGIASFGAEPTSAPPLDGPKLDRDREWLREVVGTLLNLGWGPCEVRDEVDDALLAAVSD